jgi:hypothetical protein
VSLTVIQRVITHVTNSSLQNEPDLEIAGLRIWICGRQFPECEDFWDGNWLHVKAVCCGFGSRVEIDGPIVHLGEIDHLASQLDVLYGSLKGKASLDCIEPNLGVDFSVSKAGQVSVKVQITADHMQEQHQMMFEIDQTYLPPIIAGCRSILQRYPIREPEKLGSDRPGAV